MSASASSPAAQAAGALRWLLVPANDGARKLALEARSGQCSRSSCLMVRVPLSHCDTQVASFQPGGRTGPWADVEYRSGSLPYSHPPSLPTRPRAAQASGTVASSVGHCSAGRMLPPMMLPRVVSRVALNVLGDDLFPAKSGKRENSIE